MCGIAGKVRFAGPPVAEADVIRMRDTLAHRGPDDAGLYLSPDRRVGLGNRRLAILDLSPRGHQPMNYQNRYWITFNGEIYNFLDKKRKLEREGFTFHSDTDTEVILALYVQYKEKCIQHLRGMFAFAIYDEQEQVLFCARDRLGKKPFKYYVDNNVFLFASELKAILTQPEYHTEIDYTAVHHYLTLQYVPAPLTGFKNIHKLEPGHWLKIDIKQRQLQKERYWQLHFEPKLNLSEREWQEQILAKLRESVRLRLISDVPLGALLSGGLDSSAIVALMSEGTSQVRTFSIGFKETTHNELPYAREVAKRFGTQHTEFIVEPKAIEVLPTLIEHFEEPFADSSALPTYYLSTMTRQHVTVALNGDGGDENFAGYPRYSVQKFALWYQHAHSLHRALLAPIITGANRLFPTPLLEKARRFSDTLCLPYTRRYAAYIGYFLQHQKRSLYADDFSEKLDAPPTEDLLAQVFSQSKASDKLDQTLFTDVNTYLPDDLLVKMDIASMAVGLEARSPLLDHELMELTASMPSSLKLKGFLQGKYIFRKALHDILPPSALERRKQGFSPPLAAWLRGELKEFLYDTLLSSSSITHSFLKAPVMQELTNQHLQRHADHSKSLWVLLMLELWMRRFFPS